MKCPLAVLVIIFVVGTVGLVSNVSKLTSKLYDVTYLFCKLAFFVLRRCICTVLTFTALKILMPFFCCGIFKGTGRKEGVFVNSANDLAVNVVLYFLDLGLAVYKLSSGAKGMRPVILTFSPLLIPYYSIIEICLRQMHGKGGPFLPSGGRVRRGLLTLKVGRHGAVVVVISISAVFVLLGVLLSLCLGIG